MVWKANFDVLWPGSYPYLKATQALKLYKTRKECLPHWPQLPKRHKKELMLEQTHAAMKTKNGGFSKGSAQGWSPALRWASRLKTKRPFKSQIAGPLTLLWKYAVENNTVKNAAKRSAKKNRKSTIELLMESVDSWLKHAYWQIQEIKNQDLTPILVLDEPLLPTYLGPSSSTRSQKILKVYKSLVTRLQKKGAIVGIHCCNRVNINVLLETGVNCVYFDAYHFPSLLKAARNDLQAFLRDGGYIAWGIVPTAERLTPIIEQKLVQTLENCLISLEGRGLSIHKIATQSCIAPVCGTGLLRIEQAEAIFEATSFISKTLKKRYKLAHDSGV